MGLQQQTQKLWTTDETVTLRELWDRGLTHEQIGAAIGREFNSVQRKCFRLGLKRDKPDYWTAEREQILRDGWAAGLSFAMIAAEIGCSRNASVAKAYRLGLKGKTVGQRSARKPNRKKGQRTEPEVPDLPIPINFKGVSLFDLEPGMCRYPQGDGIDTLFCGNAVVPETSWCRTCSRIVYQGAA